MGRNPPTGNREPIRTSKVQSFKAGNSLREGVDEGSLPNAVDKVGAEDERQRSHAGASETLDVSNSCGAPKPVGTLVEPECAQPLLAQPFAPGYKNFWCTSSDNAARLPLRLRPREHIGATTPLRKRQKHPRYVGFASLEENYTEQMGKSDNISNLIYRIVPPANSFSKGTKGSL